MSKVRVPVGRLILELPAGMLDDDKGDFAGTAVREVSLFLSNIKAYGICVCLFVFSPYFLVCTHLKVNYAYQPHD